MPWDQSMQLQRGFEGSDGTNYSFLVVNSTSGSPDPEKIYFLVSQGFNGADEQHSNIPSDGCGTSGI